jgi:hypothetical protein
VIGDEARAQYVEPSAHPDVVIARRQRHNATTCSPRRGCGRHPAAVRSSASFVPHPGAA